MTKNLMLVIGVYGKSFYKANGKAALSILTEVANRAGAARAELLKK